MAQTLFQRLKEKGIKTDNHYSDLYFPVTSDTVAILQEFPKSLKAATKFVNRVEGGIWFDVPFAYDPYWDRKLDKN